MDLPYNTAIRYIGIYVRQMKTCPQKDLYKNVHDNQICNSQKLETAQVINKKKRIVRHIHTTEYDPATNYQYMQQCE